MSYQDEIIAFLAQPENLPIALEVAEYVSTIKEEIHQIFWPLFSTQVRELLYSSDLKEDWVFVPLPENQLQSRFGKCYISPTNYNIISAPQLQVGFGQSTPHNRYHLYRGVRWTKEPKGINHPKLDLLTNLLNGKALTVSDNNWPGWNYYSYRLHNEDFIIRIHQEPEALVKELVDEFWQLFTDLRPLLQEINSDLSVK